MQRASLIIRSLWAACLLLAAANHARILIQYGLFWDYGGVAWPSAVYWTSLTFIDPLVAALLFVRARIGIIGTIGLIATNVAHNQVVTAIYAPEGEFLMRASHPFLLSQIGFLIFVAATAQIAWKGAPCGGHPHPARPA